MLDSGQELGLNAIMKTKHTALNPARKVPSKHYSRVTVGDYGFMRHPAVLPRLYDTARVAIPPPAGQVHYCDLPGVVGLRHDNVKVPLPRGRD